MELFWTMMALVVPAALVVALTRLSRNKYIAVLLTFIVFAVAIQRGYFYSEWTIFLDAVSIILGYMLVEIYDLDQFDDKTEE